MVWCRPIVEGGRVQAREPRFRAWLDRCSTPYFRSFATPLSPTFDLSPRLLPPPPPPPLQLFLIEDQDAEAQRRARGPSFTPLRPVDPTEHFVSIDLGTAESTAGTPAPWHPPCPSPRSTAKRLLGLWTPEWTPPTTPRLGRGARPGPASSMVTPKDGPCTPAGGSRSGTSSPGTVRSPSVLHFSVFPDRGGCLGVILGAAAGGSAAGPIPSECSSELTDNRDIRATGSDDAAIAAGSFSTDVPVTDGGGDNVVVQRLLPGGLGWLSRTLKQGDELLCVNGRSVQGYTTADAVNAITEANAECLQARSAVKLVVLRVCAAGSR